MKILDRLPISEKRTSLRFGDRYVHSPPQPGAGMGERPSGRGPGARREHPEVPGPAGYGEQLRLLLAGPPPARVGRDRPESAGDPWEPRDQWAVRNAPKGDCLAVPEHPRPAGGSQRQAAVPVEDGQRDRCLQSRRCPSQPAITPAGASRLPRQRPRLVARSGTAAGYRADADLAQASHPSPLPIVTLQSHVQRRQCDRARTEFSKPFVKAHTIMNRSVSTATPRQTDNTPSLLACFESLPLAFAIHPRATDNTPSSNWTEWKRPAYVASREATSLSRKNTACIARAANDAYSIQATNPKRAEQMPTRPRIVGMCESNLRLSRTTASSQARPI